MFHAMPLQYIPYDKYGWISDVYNVLRIVWGRKLFTLYKSTIDFATFIDISVIWFTKFNFLSRCMPENFVTEVLLIVLLPTLISGQFTSSPESRESPARRRISIQMSDQFHGSGIHQMGIKAYLYSHQMYILESWQSTPKTRAGHTSNRSER